MSHISCIIYPPSLDYYYMLQRPQQLMRAFSELKIPSYFMSRPYLAHRRAGIEKVNSCFYILNQVDIKPYLNGCRPVVYFSSPDDIAKVGDYNPALVVFDSLDEPSDEFEPWRKHYRKAVEYSDIVLASSQKLYEQAVAINPNTHLIPNACDYEFFSQAGRSELPVPGDMTDFDGTIIGYMGAVATWCDFGLIELIADKFPDCHIVLVGPLYNVSRVPARPNLHWLGLKPYHQLPAYLQCFNAAIIPFIMSSVTEAVNPIKMWEYMAAGIPVVTTALPEAEKYPGLILYSENHESFVENLKTVFREDTPNQRLQRRELASRNSWGCRARQIVDLIEAELIRKGLTDNRVYPAALPISPGMPYPRTINLNFKSAINIDLR